MTDWSKSLSRRGEIGRRIGLKIRSPTIEEIVKIASDQNLGGQYPPETAWFVLDDGTFVPQPELPPEWFVQIRLRARVVVDLAGCWLWQGACDPAGYGAIKIDGKKRNAHVVAYEAFIGPVPDGRIVCHRCEARACINPEHLYAGTYRSNRQDADRAGRRSGGQKLTIKQARAIRFDSRPTSVIAATYKVSESTIHKIKRGVMYRER